MNPFGKGTPNTLGARRRQEAADAQRYDVFVRDWYVHDPKYPGGLRPQAGERTYLAHGVCYEQALEMCADYNDEHDPGPLSRKAEFERE